MRRPVGCAGDAGLATAGRGVASAPSEVHRGLIAECPLSRAFSALVQNVFIFFQETPTGHSNSLCLKQSVRFTSIVNQFCIHFFEATMHV
jgi:hypothetical protein